MYNFGVDEVMGCWSLQCGSEAEPEAQTHGDREKKHLAEERARVVDRTSRVAEIGAACAGHEVVSAHRRLDALIRVDEL